MPYFYFNLTDDSSKQLIFTKFKFCTVLNFLEAIFKNKIEIVDW